MLTRLSKRLYYEIENNTYIIFSIKYNIIVNIIIIFINIVILLNQYNQILLISLLNEIELIANYISIYYY